MTKLYRFQLSMLLLIAFFSVKLLADNDQIFASAVEHAMRNNPVITNYDLDENGRLKTVAFLGISGPSSLHFKYSTADVVPDSVFVSVNIISETDDDEHLVTVPHEIRRIREAVTPVLDKYDPQYVEKELRRIVLNRIPKSEITDLMFDELGRLRSVSYGPLLSISFDNTTGGPQVFQINYDGAGMPDDYEIYRTKNPALFLPVISATYEAIRRLTLADLTASAVYYNIVELEIDRGFRADIAYINGQIYLTRVALGNDEISLDKVTEFNVSDNGFVTLRYKSSFFSTRELLLDLEKKSAQIDGVAKLFRYSTSSGASSVELADRFAAKHRWLERVSKYDPMQTATVALGTDGTRFKAQTYLSLLKTHIDILRGPWCRSQLKK